MLWIWFMEQKRAQNRTNTLIVWYARSDSFFCSTRVLKKEKSHTLTLQFCLTIEFLVCNYICRKFTEVLTECTDMMWIYLPTVLYEYGIGSLTVRCINKVWGSLQTECHVEFLDPRCRHQHLTWEYCIMRTFIMCVFCQTRW